MRCDLCKEEYDELHPIRDAVGKGYLWLCTDCLMEYLEVWYV